MNNKKKLYIILSIVAVILVAVIVVAMVLLNKEPAAGGQTDIGTTAATQTGVVDGDDANVEPSATTEATVGVEGPNIGVGGNDKPAGEQKPNTPADVEEKPGIDFDELLS